MKKLYFILGCTACGKGGVGRELSRRLGAEIVSVDSMKVYRRMDIGTAKPAAEVRAAIPHHCLDIVEPSESFSVARFLEYADRALEQIRDAGHVPLAVGGTSLYIKALAEGLFDGPAADPILRRLLLLRAQAEGLTALHAELAWKDPRAAGRIHPNDAKRIVRALEVHHATGKPISELQHQWDAGDGRYDCVMIGLRRTKEDLHGRINLRVKKMIEAGLRDEAARLLAEPAAISPQAAQAVGYAEMFEHLRGACTLEDAVEAIKINTRRLAKKQRSWHRRWTKVQWFDCRPDDAPEDTAHQILERVTFE
jgi:tRNA dimethylallyltransferase